MPFITYAERRLVDEFEQGRIDGLADALERLLRIRFGEPGEELMNRLRPRRDAELYDAVFDAAATTSTLEVARAAAVAHRSKP